MFRGAGIGNLLCECGSVLIAGYLAGNFLAIRIRCSRCGAVATTPGLAEGEILHRTAITVDAAAMPVLNTAAIGRGAIFVGRDTATRDYAQTGPERPPDEPLLLSRAMLEDAAADYDRLTGGRLAEHTAGSPAPDGMDHGTYPFAWAAARLRTRIGRPGWSWLHQDDDAMAAMYVAAMHHLMLCWGHHPLLERLAAPLARPDRFIRAVCALGLAKQLFEGGNRVRFALSADDVELQFATAVDQPLSLALLTPDALQWRRRERRSPEVFRETMIDALASAQGTVNRSRPGIVALAVSILQPDFDQMAVDAIHAAFQAVGRRHRGVAAVAIVMPKVLPAGQPDYLGFGYALYPIPNPRFVGANPVRLEPAPGT